MTVIAVGTDIVSISRIETALDRWGERFAEKILHPREMEQFRKQLKPAQLIARRFCAKEAVAKSLKTGMRGGVSFTQIEIVHDRYGAPGVVLHGQAEKHRKRLGITALELSISDEQAYAVAFVVASK